MTTDTTDRPTVATLARRLDTATRELDALKALVDVALASPDHATVTIISAKVHRPIAPLSQARALAARARMWPILKRARGLQ